MPESPSDPVVQYLIHPAFRARLDAWLTSQGFEALPFPQDGESMPTFIVAPGAELIEAVNDLSRFEIEDEDGTVRIVDRNALVVSMLREFATDPLTGMCTVCSHRSIHHRVVGDDYTGLTLCDRCECKTRTA